MESDRGTAEDRGGGRDMSQSVAGSRATRIAKVAMDGLGLIALLAAVVIAAWLLLSPLLMQKTGVEPAVKVPVAIGSGSVLRTVPLRSPDTLLASHPLLVHGEAELQFRTTNWVLQFLVNGVTLLGVAIVLLAIHLVRSFLAEVKAGAVFTLPNARRLSRLGWLLVAVGVGAPILEYWRSSMVLGRAQLEGVALAPAILTGWNPILAGVLVLVLAAAWRYGVELQRDRDLTV